MFFPHCQEDSPSILSSPPLTKQALCRCDDTMAPMPKCSQVLFRHTVHYSYPPYSLRASARFSLCHHTSSCNPNYKHGGVWSLQTSFLLGSLMNELCRAKRRATGVRFIHGACYIWEMTVMTDRNLSSVTKKEKKKTFWIQWQVRLPHDNQHWLSLPCPWQA